MIQGEGIGLVGWRVIRGERGGSGGLGEGRGGGEWSKVEEGRVFRRQGLYS